MYHYSHGLGHGLGFIGLKFRGCLKYTLARYLCLLRPCIIFFLYFSPSGAHGSSRGMVKTMETDIVLGV